jgi:hypothetical protein
MSALTGTMADGEQISTGESALDRYRTTEDDLAWWLDFAGSREWTFAKTYAATAPHDYIVQDRSPGVTHDDVVRAAHVIHTFGVPGKYYGLTKIYLTSPDGKLRWWTEDSDLSTTTLVNQARTDRHYGVQNAPFTVSGIRTPYDEVATRWDSEHPSQSGEAEAVTALLTPHRGTYPPHALDLGCGTGRVLSLGLVAPGRYAGVDSSQAMLNMLVIKHPAVAALYPMDVRAALESDLFTSGQFDWVFLDASVDLSSQEVERAQAIARHALITVTDTTWSVTASSEADLGTGESRPGIQERD